MTTDIITGGFAGNPLAALNPPTAVTGCCSGSESIGAQGCCSTPATEGDGSCCQAVAAPPENAGCC